MKFLTTRSERGTFLNSSCGKYSMNIYIKEKERKSAIYVNNSRANNSRTEELRTVRTMRNALHFAVAR